MMDIDAAYGVIYQVKGNIQYRVSEVLNTEFSKFAILMLCLIPESGKEKKKIKYPPKNI